jgi:eukaryotic-like serine/threonine-protein kinase
MARNGISSLFTKQFFIHFILSLLTVFIVSWITLTILSGYTNHNETITVPNLKGKNFTSATSIVEEKKLKIAIMDSVYDDTKPKGIVLDQNPSANYQVKENRTIYVTLNASNPPMVSMPNLIDASLRQAKAILNSLGLELGNIIYKPDMAKNAVLGQAYLNKNINAGTQVKMGAKIDLIVGDGLSGEQIQVPVFIGLNLSEAKALLKKNNLLMGAVV